MVQIHNKLDCCGCTACVSVCPKSCITMKEDKEGFLYPEADRGVCINCGACIAVCPIRHIGHSISPIQCYAVKNKDNEVLKNSSSGGGFSMLAQYTLQEKQGVVFGAMWDGGRVIHGDVKCVDDLHKIRGSKYVQSDLRDTLRKAEVFLKEGRFVMFSGTPCEIAGLKSFLRKEYENLLTVDIACHGVPSPMVLSMYLNELKRNYRTDSLRLNFRDKKTGWATYSVSAWDGEKCLFSEHAMHNVYMNGYLHELFSRPLCYDCPFKSFKSGSDITLADFWGIKKVLPSYNSSEGVGLVIVNTNIGTKIIADAADKSELIRVDFQDAVRENVALFHSEQPHPKRTAFFRALTKKSSTKAFSSIVLQAMKLDVFTMFRLSFQAKLRSARSRFSI